jgi:hypothetical protein
MKMAITAKVKREMNGVFVQYNEMIKRTAERTIKRTLKAIKTSTEPKTVASPEATKMTVRTIQG